MAEPERSPFQFPLYHTKRFGPWLTLAGAFFAVALMGAIAIVVPRVVPGLGGTVVAIVAVWACFFVQQLGCRRGTSRTPETLGRAAFEGGALILFSGYVVAVEILSRRYIGGWRGVGVTILMIVLCCVVVNAVQRFRSTRGLAERGGGMRQ